MDLTQLANLGEFMIAPWAVQQLGSVLQLRCHR